MHRSMNITNIPYNFNKDVKDTSWTTDKGTQEIKLKICSNRVDDDDHCLLGHSTM
jgi:hypothetical protein